MEESITLDIDGVPVRFTVAPTGGGGSYQLSAEGTVLATPSRQSLSHYGRSELVSLYREAVQGPRAPTPAPFLESPIVMVSSSRAYVYPDAEDGTPGGRVMLYRTGSEWTCGACGGGACEHVEQLSRRRGIMAE